VQGPLQGYKSLIEGGQEETIAELMYRGITLVVLVQRLHMNRIIHFESW
jgi:hypothetical protein